MDVHIEFSGGRGHRDEIYRQLRAAILDGRIREGESLPPTRELARRLAISRTTVSAAYDRLTAEGFLAAKVGSGTFVRAGAGRHLTPPPGEPVASLRGTAVWDDVPRAPRGFAPSPEFDFRAGVPDVSRFPFAAWRRLVAAQVRISNADLMTYADPGGHPALREAIARHVGVSRDVRAAPADVLVTSGAQQALDLVARVLLKPGDVAAVEDPGYPPPRLLLHTLGVRTAAVPVDSEGLVVDALPDDCRVVYVTPSHQYPLGVSMSLARRLELLAWAERHDAAIVEDDYDTEFRYTGRPLEPLYSLDTGRRVLYVGSFSKVLSPALRLGFLVAPPSLRDVLTKAKYLTDWHSAAPAQAVLAEFIDEGGFAAHIRRMRREYQTRHDLVAAILKRDFAGMLDVIPSSVGLHLSAFGHGDSAAVRRAARQAGVTLYSLGDFAVEKRTTAGFVFGYGAIAADRIEAGLCRLREVMADKGGD